MRESHSVNETAELSHPPVSPGKPTPVPRTWGRGGRGTMNNTLAQLIQQVPAGDLGARDALFSALTQVDEAHQARRWASRSPSPQPREETTLF